MVSKSIAIRTVLVGVSRTIDLSALGIEVGVVAFDWLAEGITIGGITQPRLSDLQCIVQSVGFVTATALRYVTVSIYAVAIERKHAVEAGVVGGFDLS